MPDQFPHLTAALGDPPKVVPFPGAIVCANCNDRPCGCCPECGAAFRICDPGCPEGDQRVAEVRIRNDPAVLEAVRVLTKHGIDGTKYEALQALKKGSS